MNTVLRTFRNQWQRIRTEPRFGRNLLAVLVLVVLGVVSGGVILSKQGSGLTSWPWHDQFEFQAVFDEAHGVAAGQGQAVRIAGVTVGAIEGAEVNDDGKAVLELSIDRDYELFDNARLVLRPQSPLNEMYVTIDPGGPPGEPIGEGDRLPIGNTDTPVTIDRVTEHLDEETREGLSTLLNEADIGLANSGDRLADGLAGTDRVLQELQPVMDELHVRQDELSKLITAVGTIADAVGGDNERLTQLAGDLEETLRTLADQSHPLDESLEQLPDVAAQLGRSTDAVTELSEELDPTLDNVLEASESLPQALGNLRETAETAEPVVDKSAPVVEQLDPVVADLRPVAEATRSSMPDLTDISAHLEPVTAALMPYLEDLRAFTYNTASMTSLRDGNAPVIRAHLVASPDTIPLLQDLATESN